MEKIQQGSFEFNIMIPEEVLARFNRLRVQEGKGRDVELLHRACVEIEAEKKAAQELQERMDCVWKMVKQHPGIKAAEIAKELGLTRLTVNHYLYSIGNVIVDEKFRWYPLKIKTTPPAQAVQEVKRRTIGFTLKQKPITTMEGLKVYNRLNLHWGIGEILELATIDGRKMMSIKFPNKLTEEIYPYPQAIDNALICIVPEYINPFGEDHGQAYIDLMRQKYKNYQVKWSAEDDKLLADCIKKKIHPRLIAEKLGRTEASIIAKAISNNLFK